MNPFSLVLLLCITFSEFVVGHGFSTATLVNVPPNHWECIGQLAERAVKKRRRQPDVCVWSYCNGGAAIKEVTRGAIGRTNCYFRLGFDDYFNDDILCTPIQEFYLPLQDQWVPAYTLQVGDVLLSKGAVHKALTHIEFVVQQLQIYSIEVKDTHCFFVGRHAILTHNMVIPFTVMAGASMAFGSGATAGGSAGAFFGPVTFFGGIVVGGVIGFTIKALCNNHAKPGYDVEFNVNDVNVYRDDINCARIIFDPQKQFSFNAPEKDSEKRRPVACCGSPTPPNDPRGGGSGNSNKNDYRPDDSKDQKRESEENKKDRVDPNKKHTMKDFFDSEYGKQVSNKIAPTRQFCQSARVYKVVEKVSIGHLQKGDLFYLDMLHRNHVEVFDSKGLGKCVLNMDGSKNFAKSDLIRGRRLW